MATNAVAVDRDQDPLKVSNRLGSVWSDVNRRQESGFSPDAQKMETGRSKRREAATWLQQVAAGASVPSDSDSDFRGALADGTILCKVANMLCPDAIKAVHQVQGANCISNQKRYENIQSFIKVVQGMDVPSDSTFSYEDLTSGSEQPRPRVADCVLWLKRLWEHHEGGGNVALANDLSPSMDSSRKAAVQLVSGRTGSGGAFQYSPQYPAGKQVPLAMAPKAGSGSPPGPLPAAQGVAQILHHWSSVLKHNGAMASSGAVAGGPNVPFNPNSSADFSIDSMGPIFHKVLSSLTSEYERRLSTKDQDVTRARDAFSQLQSQMSEVQRQLEVVKTQLSNQQHNQVANAAHQAAVQQLQQAADQLRQEVSDRQRQCAELQWQLDNAGQANDQQVLDLVQEVDGLKGRLGEFQDLELRFKATRDENRKLFNQVQDLKGAIRVFCRIRPPGRTGDAGASCTEVGEDGELAIHDPAGQQECRVHRFDKIFGESATQAEVYEDTQPLIRSVLDGYNVCIFAYGQTGSGKTHTMSGTNVERPEGRGINYRALDDLFEMVEERKNEVQYSIKVQMLEIYNETLRDLLTRNGHAAKLELLNTMASGCNVRNAEQLTVSCSSMILDLMEQGSKNRHVAETKMNERSSRSHQVLTVIVDGVNVISGAATHACLNLVDLAGSERVAKSKAAGDRLVETCAINSSLSSLGDVMAALARKDNHIPFRNSKLTQLLADSLSGQAKCMMFMHISPESSFVSETQSTLLFGSKVSTITLGQAKRQVDNSKLFANEEVIRSRKDSQDKEDQLQSLHRKWQEEAKQRELLQREVDRLRAQLDSSKRGGGYDPSVSMESIRSISRMPDTATTPSTRSRPAQVKVLALHSITPVATPNTARRMELSGCLTPQSTRAIPMRVERPPTVPPARANNSGSQTARETSHPAKPPALSARPGGVYGGARPQAPAGLPAPPASMRTSSSYSAIPSIGTQAAPAGRITLLQRSASSTTASTPAFTAPPPASAGGRRSSIGQWKS